ncbi:UNVERIFIED_CONTAM: PITH domain-containing protein [Sesamum radiatum]|uniref:PITH domain-containing protein n=1 Tax=Sesamum radiatum TaxID=300843 RepID=A0AAW2VIE2_SESRA
MSAESASAIHRNQVDLLDFVDWSSVECLNQKNSHSLPNALKQGYREDEGLILESDADEQLLIYIPFNQVVKLHSIAIEGPEDEGNVDPILNAIFKFPGPKTVKLFANREHMGFSNVNDFPPSDTVILSTENLKGKPVIVKYVKFQNVRSLTVFIEDNQSGSDITKVQKIVLYGTTVETTDMKSLKKIEDH